MTEVPISLGQDKPISQPTEFNYNMTGNLQNYEINPDIIIISNDERSKTTELGKPVTDSDYSANSLLPVNKVESKSAHRINKMFKPLLSSSTHLTSADISYLNRSRGQCHHQSVTCSCNRSLNRHKQMRTHQQRAFRREQNIQNTRGDMMDFVFGREQLRDNDALNKESQLHHDAFVYSVLDDRDYDYDADDDNDDNDGDYQECKSIRVNSAIDRDQALLDEFLEQERLELEAMIEGLSLGS